MGQKELIGVPGRELPKGSVINFKTLADGPLGFFDFAVYFCCRYIHEAREYISNKRLKAQALFQFDLEIRS